MSLHSGVSNLCLCTSLSLFHVDLFLYGRVYGYKRDKLLVSHLSSTFRILVFDSELIESRSSSLSSRG